MGDRVAVMRKGELQQVADPQTLYDRPVNLFVGGFIGSPAMNMLEATVERANGGLALDLGGADARARRRRRRRAPGARGLRRPARSILGHPARAPRGGERSRRDAPADRRLRGKVELREALGSELMVHFARRRARGSPRPRRRRSSRATSTRPRAASRPPGALVVGRFGARAQVEEGEPVEVVVDTSALHFFDPETGLGIYDQADEKGATS